MKPKKHGGKRKHAGRPRANTKQYVARLTIQQVKWLQSITDAGRHLQTALTNYIATKPPTKRRRKALQTPRSATILPKDAQTPTQWASEHATAHPELKSIAYRTDEATYFITVKADDIPKDAATKNAGTAKAFGKTTSSPPTAARLTVAEVRAAKQIAYQKTLTSLR